MTSSTRPLSHRIKPTLETKFHIDYEWWKREGRDLRTYLLSHLLPEQREQFDSQQQDVMIDWVDPVTAEVHRVDALQQAVSIAAQDPNFITEHTTLVDAIFRVFLSNGNEPLTPEQLAQILNRPANTILRTLSGTRVYKGIRPLIE